MVIMVNANVKNRSQAGFIISSLHTLRAGLYIRHCVGLNVTSFIVLSSHYWYFSPTVNKPLDQNIWNKNRNICFYCEGNN